MARGPNTELKVLNCRVSLQLPLINHVRVAIQ